MLNKYMSILKSTKINALSFMTIEVVIFPLTIIVVKHGIAIKDWFSVIIGFVISQIWECSLCYAFSFVTGIECHQSLS